MAPYFTELDGRPLVPEGLDFVGRPQLIATHRGARGGRSLVLNGHIDVVSAEPVGAFCVSGPTTSASAGRW